MFVLLKNGPSIATAQQRCVGHVSLLWVVSCLVCACWWRPLEIEIALRVSRLIYSEPGIARQIAYHIVMQCFCFSVALDKHNFTWALDIHRLNVIVRQRLVHNQMIAVGHRERDCIEFVEQRLAPMGRHDFDSLLAHLKFWPDIRARWKVEGSPKFSSWGGMNVCTTSDGKQIQVKMKIYKEKTKKMLLWYNF